MDKLSLTLSHNILSRLPLVSLFNCKLVCKAWCNLVKHPNLPFLHHDFHESHNTPSLILHSPHSHGGDQLFFVNNFNYVDHDDNHQSYKGLAKEIVLPDELDDHKFTSVLHCDGFLCLSYMEVENLSTYNRILVYNLFTGELMKLPPKPMTPEYKVVSGFGYHPKNKARKVVRIVEHECVKMPDNKIDVWLMKDYGMKESWTKEFTIDPEFHLLGFLRPLWVLSNGEILAEYGKQALFSYDRNSKKIKKMNVRNLPRSFQVAPSI
ncbi:hypothetical protein COLO4_06940 [Corchorus olitorius]|uniref:F-box domain-containing protein n=1 Tax=Corchorus olitorius TaxID=93759 RepID=A0A1R3KLF4_9ROSI|nr:hypothetical protein COLO4_06940 [Corchorus olitorius]